MKHPLRGTFRNRANFLPEEGAVGLLEEEAAEDEGDNRYADGVVESGVDVAGGGADVEADEGEQSAEDSVAR